MNRALRAYRNTVGAGLALMLCACASNQFGSPCPIPDKATNEQKQAAIDGCVPGILEEPFDARQKKEVDLLFVIDNSTSMSPKQAALAFNIDRFIQEIDKFDADLHIGVVTSDVGSWTGEGAAWPSPIQGCNSFKGDDGLLQVKGCGTRMANTSSEAQNACLTYCTDAGFLNANSVTNDGARFISKVAGKTNVNNNKVVDAFKCMALIGDGGCGIEGQLESSYRALDGHLPENKGFLSDGALLAVIYITDEDDCSVKADRRSENTSSTRDCGMNPDQNASYDCYNPDYRCLARSIQCTEAMNIKGTKTNCVERPNNYLDNISKYHNFLVSLAGGQNKLLVSGIWTLNSLEKGGQLSVDYQGAGGNVSPGLNRDLGIKATCHYTGSDPRWGTVFGQAQRRLTAFARSFDTTDATTHQTTVNVPEFSICDVDNLPSVLQQIKDAIGKKLQPFCLPRVPKLLAPGQPNCLVGDVDMTSKNALPDTFLPICSSACCQGWATSANPTPADAMVKAACMNETKDCYCAVPSTVSCTDVKGWVGGVWRSGGGDPPVGKVVNFRCAAAGGS